jgi:hypothetical protein
VKRFLLFAGQTYYANGGWRDFVSSHATLDEAEAARKAEHVEQNSNYGTGWTHIVDSETEKEVVSQFEDYEEEEGGGK